MRRSIAASSRLDPNIAALASGAGLLAGPSRPDVVGKPGSLPHGLEWKARVIGELNTQLLDRARFIDAALRSVEDGLIITSPEGAIGFVNRAAAEILGPKPDTLAGRNLFELLPEARIPEGRDRVEREMVVREPKTRQLVVRASSVTADFGEVIGIVATISDITRQYELQQTKNDVISLVSHEMRTPLTAIQGMTELLADYELDLGRRREMHLAINDEVKRLTRMITEYLDITRLESGATVLRPAPLRLESLLERVLLLLVPVAGQRNIQLVRRFDAALPPLVADPDLLSRAVENLVSNAIKYSPPDTEVSVSATAGDAAVLISVADQGYGISEQDLNRIFDKFYRVPRVQDAGVPGTGLGLALVREIAELHGGSVTVVSKLNAGSTFMLRIPRPDAPR